MESLERRAKGIKLFITDVDGVLTDGRVILGNSGEEFKFFHVHDGMGIKLAQKAGIEVAIITGRESEIVSRRAKELDIKEVHQGIKDKMGVFSDLLKKYSLSSKEVAYIGDDINDLEVLKEVGLALSVANGLGEVKEVAHYITEKEGGFGAAREALDLIIKLIES